MIDSTRASGTSVSVPITSRNPTEPSSFARSNSNDAVTVTRCGPVIEPTLSFEISVKPTNAPYRANASRAKVRTLSALSDMPSGAVKTRIAASTPGSSSAAKVDRVPRSSSRLHSSCSDERPIATTSESASDAKPSPMPVHASPRPCIGGCALRMRSSAIMPSIIASAPARPTPQHDVSSATLPIVALEIASQLRGSGLEPLGVVGGVDGCSGEFSEGKARVYIPSMQLLLRRKNSASFDAPHGSFE